MFTTIAVPTDAHCGANGCKCTEACSCKPSECKC
ncbi:hypothetical protein EW026_g619 [Hermanssonia centrifuga]|uniref:Metallothionein n=1 Tax=Hermanssonia centrifuga TaxID=98765 RepID=A0A4S4KV66_9APHY|nr:hypothetical protein EW026_g619 [Hermanssonia centrifuga]